MSRKPALGRGLSALIPTARPGRETGAPRSLPLALLDANRRQPRRHFDDDGIAELARSIAKTGVLQPVLVTREGERYRILAGERRVRAARQAGSWRCPSSCARASRTATTSSSRSSRTSSAGT